MKKVSLLAILILLYSVSIAQDYYRKGFIVTLENDTIKGQINDKEWLRNPQSIEFKEDGNSVPKNFNATQIKAFATVRGIYFEAHQFKFDGDLLNGGASGATANYATARTPVKWVDTNAFLEVLVLGKLSLYKFIDDSDRTHFLVLEEGEKALKELQYREYMTNVNGLNTINTNESFKQELINYSSEACPDLKSRILKLNYSDKSLTQAVKALNTCFKSEKKIPIIEQDKIKTKRPQFGIVAYVYAGETISETLAYEGFKKIKLGGGISLEVFSKKRPNRFSVYNELKYKSFNEDGLYTFSSNPASLKFQSIKFTSMFRITNKQPKGLYFAGGINYGYRINTIFKTKSNSVTINFGSEFEYGVAIALGIRIEPIKASIELRGEFDSTTKSNSDINNHKTLGLAINKRLF